MLLSISSDRSFASRRLLSALSLRREFVKPFPGGRIDMNSGLFGHSPFTTASDRKFGLSFKVRRSPAPGNED
jgi:hypothetical protein